MRCVLLFIVVLSLAFAPVPFPKSRKTDSTKEDLKAMQGEWAERFADSAVVTIVGDRMVYSSDDAWKLTLHTKANPRRVEATGVGPRLAGKTRWGVYRLENEKLTICWRLDSAGKLDWPVSFHPVQKDVWIQVFNTGFFTGFTTLLRVGASQYFHQMLDGR